MRETYIYYYVFVFNINYIKTLINIQFLKKELYLIKIFLLYNFFYLLFKGEISISSISNVKSLPAKG